MLNNHNSHMVHEAYLARLRAIYADRRETLAGINDEASALAYVKKTRQAIGRIFGPFPKKTPLKPVIANRTDRGPFIVENIRYQSRPGLWVTANLYLPKTEGPCPAVLGACGHSFTGKAEPAYQQYAMGLVNHGFAVLIYDPIGQGERQQYETLGLETYPNTPVAQHQMLGKAMALTGDFFGSWRAWDGIRSLDYLLSRPEIDRRTVGLTGNSGGGTMTTYLTALDKRFTMAAPSCFVTSLANNLENELPADAEQCPPGMLAAGLDYADFFAAYAPRPTLLLGQQHDFFDLRGLKQAHGELKALYKQLGQPREIDLFIGPDSHGYHKANRLAMQQFFLKHAGVKGEVHEPEGSAFSPVDADDLAAAPKARVHEIQGNRMVYAFTEERVKAARKKRGKPDEAPLKQRLRKALRLPKSPGAKQPPHYRAPQAFEVGPNGCHNLAGAYKVAWPYRIETAPGICTELHALLNQTEWEKSTYLEAPPVAEDATVYVGHVSSFDDIDAGCLKKLPARLLTVDVRGVGPSRTRTCEAVAFDHAYGAEYFYAAYSSMLGESYIGDRTFDLLRTLDLLQSMGGNKLHLIGRGLGAMLVTYASVLHPAVARVTLIEALPSLESLATTRVHNWPYSVLVEDGLNQFDLPDCYRVLKAKKKLKQVRPLKGPETVPTE